MALKLQTQVLLAAQNKSLKTGKGTTVRQLWWLAWHAPGPPQLFLLHCGRALLSCALGMIGFLFVTGEQLSQAHWREAGWLLCAISGKELSFVVWNQKAPILNGELGGYDFTCASNSEIPCFHPLICPKAGMAVSVSLSVTEGIIVLTEIARTLKNYRAQGLEFQMKDYVRIDF